MSLKNLLKDSDVFGHLAHKGKGLKETSKKTFAETNQRTNCYPEKKADIPATSRTQRFHANDVSLPRYGQFFWLVQANFPRSATNQKHCPYLSGGMSSVWNFCARSSAARTPFRGETSGAGVAKCRLFSQANKEQNHKQRKAREHQEDIRGIIVKRDLQTIFAQKLSSLVTKVMSSEREKGRKYTISLMRPRNSSRLKWSCQREEDVSLLSGEILNFFLKIIILF